MARASYRSAVEWIAHNDGAGDDDALDPEAVSIYVTTLLVADIFDKDNGQVGRDVVRARERIAREERAGQAHQPEREDGG